MKVVSPANETVLTVLKKFKKPDCRSRMMKYCVETPVDEGVLLFNLLTRELLLLTGEEYHDLTGNDYLREQWFVVPEETNEKELADMVRWILRTRKKQSPHITGYTIFTTMDCNARCFYCYEKGRPRTPMSQETALKAVQYIKAHCGGEKVKLQWFGGEPLFNMAVIDTICDGLRREGVAFTSSMISNGYLFDDDTVKKAAESWNLKHIQISLDGTEAVYNRSKAYIYREGSPYQVVLKNIERLLDASIAISIRLNMDLYNADDLLTLMDELAQRFGGRKGLHVYAHHLFKGDQPMSELHSDEEWEKRDEAMCRLTEKIAQCGLASEQGISKKLTVNHCMADSGSSVTITPTGDIGLCEHFSESEFIGRIDREGFDKDMMASWRERIPEIPECADCFYYPSCLQLKKCPNGSVCFHQIRQGHLRKTRSQMLCEYRKWQTKTTEEESEDMELC